MSAISDLKNDQWNRLEFLRVKVGSLSKDLAHMSERIKVNPAYFCLSDFPPTTIQTNYILFRKLLME